MILIIEGPDGGGKTTLANAVAAEAEAQGLTVICRRCGPPDPPGRNPWEEYELGLLTEPLRNPDVLVIQDRWAMGELIYGPLVRGHSRMSRGGLLHCEMLAEAIGAVRVMMLPPLGVIVRRLQQDGDWMLLPDHKPGELFDTGEITGIWDEYSKLASLYRYDIFRALPDLSHIQVLLARLRYRGEWATQVQDQVPGYIGAQRPGVILAGDVRSGAGNPQADLIQASEMHAATHTFRHAFTPASPGSASYLMDALAIDPRRVLRGFGILNTGEEGMDLKEADSLLGPRQWVALGTNAMWRLDAAGIDFVNVPHPQYWRRFHHADLAGYAAKIFAAAGGRE